MREKLSRNDSAIIASSVERVVDFVEDYHFLPNDDWFDHIESANCACRPRADSIGHCASTINKIWVHVCIKGNKELC